MSSIKISVFSLLAAVVFLGGIAVAEDTGASIAPQILPAPVMTYTVASPRMTIIKVPRYQIASDGTKIELPGTPYGAAENFARKDGELKVPAGVRVVFCLSRALEGVWYDQTYGRLSTAVILQKFVPAAATTTGVGSWVEIGADKAGEVRRGPSITHAKVGVPITFREPGTFLLRAIVRTEAQPLAGETATNLVWPAAIDVDTVLIRVKVVNKPILEVVPDEDPSADPDLENVRPLFKDMNANTDLLPGDINGDDIVDMADLMTLSQQWCQEKEVPLTSID